MSQQSTMTSQAGRTRVEGWVLRVGGVVAMRLKVTSARMVEQEILLCRTVRAGVCS
jgi:hypothetical protein